MRTLERTPALQGKGCALAPVSLAFRPPLLAAFSGGCAGRALEAGQSDTLTAFLTAVAKFHQYSFGNVMLIAAQRPDATRVAGFNAWRKLGRSVNKGETGIVIIAPIPFRRDTDTIVADDETRETGMRFKAAYVFDVSRTDGEPLPQLTRVTGDPGEYATRVKHLIRSRGIALDYTEDLAGADGQSAGGRITVRVGLDPAEEFSVLVHELAHEMLHHTSEQRLPKTVRETEAEAVAFIVSEGVGLTTGTAAAGLHSALPRRRRHPHGVPGAHP